jgi:hypothetical protein
LERVEQKKDPGRSSRGTKQERAATIAQNAAAAKE